MFRRAPRPELPGEDRVRQIKRRQRIAVGALGAGLVAMGAGVVVSGSADPKPGHQITAAEKSQQDTGSVVGLIGLTFSGVAFYGVMRTHKLSKVDRAIMAEFDSNTRSANESQTEVTKRCIADCPLARACSVLAIHNLPDTDDPTDTYETMLAGSIRHSVRSAQSLSDLAEAQKNARSIDQPVVAEFLETEIITLGAAAHKGLCVIAPCYPEITFVRHLKRNLLLCLTNVDNRLNWHS